MEEQKTTADRRSTLKKIAFQHFKKEIHISHIVPGLFWLRRLLPQVQEGEGQEEGRQAKNQPVATKRTTPIRGNIRDSKFIPSRVTHMGAKKK